jgi:hypothetical protein
VPFKEVAGNHSLRECPLAGALPAPEQTEGFAISLPVGNWIVFYSFVIDHEIPFAYERPLCANSGQSGTGKLLRIS